MDIKELLGKYKLKIEVKKIEQVKKWQEMRFGYDIEIYNIKNNTKKNFNFFGSVCDFKQNNKNIDFIIFLDCITAEAFYYDYSLEDFLKEFDYSLTEGTSILKQCKETYKKLLNIFETNENLINFRNKLDYLLNN
jgi:hypothetical protein